MEPATPASQNLWWHILQPTTGQRNRNDVRSAAAVASVGGDAQFVAEAEVPNEEAAPQTSTNLLGPSTASRTSPINTDATTPTAATAQGQETTVPALQPTDDGSGVTCLVGCDTQSAAHAEVRDEESATNLPNQSFARQAGTPTNTGMPTSPTGEAEDATVTLLQATGNEQVQSPEVGTTSQAQEAVVPVSQDPAGGPDTQPTAETEVRDDSEPSESANASALLTSDAMTAAHGLLDTGGTTSSPKSPSGATTTAGIQDTVGGVGAHEVTTTNPELHEHNTGGEPRRETPSEISIDDHCLCVINEYIDRTTMDYINALPQTWSLQTQEEASRFILSRQEMFRDAYRELSTKSRRLLCQAHIRHLAKLVGLRVPLAGYETFTHRLAFIATNASTYEDFKIKILNGKDTAHWFRNGVSTQAEPQSRNLLHPYRFKAVEDTRGYLERLQQKIRANPDNILSDILSWYVGDHSLTSTQEFSYVDVPKVFNWILDNQSGRSIAEIAMIESTIHRFHLKTAERPENSGNHLAFGFQFSLVQQIIEQHPLFYLLNLLLQPGDEKSIFLVSYPNPAIISALHGKSDYAFPADPKAGELAGLRAVLPIMDEDYDSCDSVLECLDGTTDMRDFLQEYTSTAMERSVAAEPTVPGYRLDSEVVDAVVSTQSDRFHVTPRPVKTGSIRLLKSTVATASHGERFALQPQLVPVVHYDTAPVLRNGISLETLQSHRANREPLLKTPFGMDVSTQISSWALSDSMPSISALSEAIQVEKSFYHSSVLGELELLLSGSKDRFTAFIDHWNQAAANILAIKAGSLEGMEEILYPGKCSKNCDVSDIQSDVELVPVHSGASEEREEPNIDEEHDYGHAHDDSSDSSQRTNDDGVCDTSVSVWKRVSTATDCNLRKRRRLE